MDSMSKILLVMGFVCAISSSLLSQELLWDNSYYHLMEASFCLYLSSLYICVKCGVKYSDKWIKVPLFVLLSSISTICDELFYDATKVELNDLIRLVSIFAFVKLYKPK